MSTTHPSFKAVFLKKGNGFTSHFALVASSKSKIRFSFSVLSAMSVFTERGQKAGAKFLPGAIRVHGEFPQASKPVISVSGGSLKVLHLYL